MIRLIALSLVVGVFILSSWASGGHLGTSSECRNTECVVTASSSALSLVIAFALAIILALYRPNPSTDDHSRIVGVWRRFGAFLLDLAVVLMIVAPFGAVPILLAEAKYSGSFQWSFTRHFSRPTDIVLILPGALAALLALFFYFYYYARSQKATIGQFIMGYRVLAESEAASPNFVFRVVLSFVGLCAWPVSLVPALRKPNRAFWWDEATRTKVTRVVG
jgi:uncharacterized RDD family membrane protein YckC